MKITSTLFPTESSTCNLTTVSSGHSILKTPCRKPCSSYLYWKISGQGLCKGIRNFLPPKHTTTKTNNTTTTFFISSKNKIHAVWPQNSLFGGPPLFANSTKNVVGSFTFCARKAIWISAEGKFFLPITYCCNEDDEWFVAVRVDLKMDLKCCKCYIRRTLNWHAGDAMQIDEWLLLLIVETGGRFVIAENNDFC